MTKPQKENKPILIIGGGPAGIAAAIQLKRQGLESLLLERGEPGGLLRNANLVENYPGFPNGIRGPELTGLMRSQMERLGVEAKREEVERVDWKRNRFVVTTNRAVHPAYHLIVASGTKSKPIPTIVPAAAHGRIFTEVWPLLGEREKRIVIVGAGDAAFDYALNLSEKGNFIVLLHRGETVKCTPALFERAAREPRLTYRARTAVRQIKAGKTAARLNVETDAETLEADYILFAIGREPNLDFLSADLRRLEKELMEAGRLYFVGDVVNGLYRQTAIAAGDGLRAAMQIYSRIVK